MDALTTIAQKYDAAPSQVALNWLMNFREDRVVVIPGASTSGQAEQNAGSMSFKLSGEDLAFLDEVSSVYEG